MSNKQQTALQQAIDYLKERHSFLLDGGVPTTESAIDEIDNCIAFLESKLELEKEQIIDANNDGQSLHAKSVTNLMIRDNAENYYEQTYGE